MSKFQKDLTKGSVARHLIVFSLPFLAANFLQALYNMSDMFFVARFNGAAGATAVGVGGQLSILLLNLIAGLAVGATVLIARFLGAGKQKDVERTVSTVFTLYGAAAVVLTVVMFILNPLILRLLVSEEAVYKDTLLYANICTGGMIFIFGYNAVSAVLRGMGDSKHPLYFVTISSVLDIGMNALFCGVFRWGAAGAAWSTVFAQGLSFLLSVWFLRRQKFMFDFHPKSFRIDKDIAMQLLRVGLPASIGGTTVSLSFIGLTYIANGIAGIVGTTVLSVAGKVNSVAILPAFALQSATSSMAGQNLGANKQRRALQTCLTAIAITMCVTLPLMLLAQAFGEPIFRFFVGADSDGLTPELFQACLDQFANYLRSVSWDYIIVAVTFNITGLAIAAGHTKFTLTMSALSSLLLRLPLAWLLGKSLGLIGVGYAIPLAGVAVMLIDVGYLLSGKWKKSKGMPGQEQEILESMAG